MNRLYEEGDVVYSEAHAKELLGIQANYNKMLQELNNKLAKQKSDCNVKFMKIAQQQTAAQKAAEKAKVTPQTTTNTTKQTGTVDTAGNTTNVKGNPAAPTVESIDILRVKELNEEGERMTGKMDWGEHHDMSNWYEKAKLTPKTEDKKESRKRVKHMTWEVRQKLIDIKREIQDLKSDLSYYTEKFYSPELMGGETEEFFAQLGPEASEILNSGVYETEEEKLRALQQAGVPYAKGVLRDYYHYYPEFNPALDADRKKGEKEIPKIETQIQKLQDKYDKMESMYESVNESTFLIKNVDPYELQDLKDYLDAENISYAEDEDGETIDFDKTELDQEWQDKMDEMGFEDNDSETNDILTIADDGEESTEDDFAETDEKINEEKVFYVKVDDEGEEFVGKIYKLFDEGDWRAKVISGNSDTFEQLNYDPDFDEVDIIAFLRENYADAEILSEDEFNSHVEDSEAEPEEEVEEGLIGNGNMTTNKSRIREHEIPTFDQYLNEIKFSDGMEFDTSGELHTEERNDGWYVVGKNMLIPVKSEQEGNEYIMKLEKK